jgi:hypothetical protein
MVESPANTVTRDKPLRSCSPRGWFGYGDGSAMNQKGDTTGNHTPAEAVPGKKKPYQKPEVRCESVFETQALACGKVNITQSQCKSQAKLS